jgi:hypothetical protein
VVRAPSSASRANKPDEKALPSKAGTPKKTPAKASVAESQAIHVKGTTANGKAKVPASLPGMEALGLLSSLAATQKLHGEAVNKSKAKQPIKRQEDTDSNSDTDSESESDSSDESSSSESDYIPTSKRAGARSEQRERQKKRQNVLKGLLKDASISLMKNSGR